MQLISVEDYRLALALAAVPPTVAAGLLLRRPGLAEAEIARAERALGLGPLPASFTGLLTAYDFGNFDCLAGQFGGCPGSAGWLLRANDPAAFGFEVEGVYTPGEAVFHLRPAGGPPSGNEPYFILTRH